MIRPWRVTLVNFGSASSGLNSFSGRIFFHGCKIFTRSYRILPSETLQKKVRDPVVASPPEVLLALIVSFDHHKPVIMIQRTGNTD